MSVLLVVGTGEMIFIFSSVEGAFAGMRTSDGFKVAGIPPLFHFCICSYHYL